MACRDGGGASAYDRDMADFSHILATRPDFDDEDREWLHHLVADWQVIADLSFADLLLLVQDGDGKYVVAEQCRPSTVMTLRAEDVVGNVMPDDMVGELDAAMLSSVVFRSTVLRTVGKATVCNVYAPVRHNGKTLGLVVRETNMATRESNGRYESESINAGKHLYEMIPRGQFPYKDSVMSQRHIARVADGFIILTMDGVVRYAAPNAISCFRRLGLLTTMPGHYLSELGTQLLKENDPVPETLPLVLTGKAAVDSELNANRSAVSMRSLPLYDNNGRIGAILLCRDVTELRRREQELQTKDATISEIHHRVKNNLHRSQTVSLSPLSKSRGNRQVLDGREVVVGFDRSQWSARCASRFNQRYGYFPYCRSKDEGLKEYSGEWKARNELRNETVSRIKREILHGEFKEERRLYMNVCRLYRFVVNPRKAIIQELERLGTDLLTGRER